jgi:amphiphysin
MCACQKRIAESICLFYGELDELSLCGMKYKELVDNIDAKSRVEMDETFRKTVLEPTSRYTGYFPVINDVIKKRSKKLLDYDAARSKAKKLVDNPSDDPSKLPKVKSSFTSYQRLNSNV